MEATMAMKLLLLETLDDLGDEDFNQFKWHLEFKGLKKAKLEKADRNYTVDQITQKYNEKSVEICVDVLRRILRNDLAEKLSNAASEFKGEVKDVQGESSSNMIDRSTEEINTPMFTSSASPSGSPVPKKKFCFGPPHHEESAAETKLKCDPVNQPDDDKHLEMMDDDTTVGGEAKIKPEMPPVTNRRDTVGEDMCETEVGNRQMSEKISREMECQRETETLFCRLQLEDKRQEKFKPADFLKIGPTVKQNSETCEKDLAHTFLQRLMMLDYRARHIPVKQESAEVGQSMHVPRENPETEESVLDALYSTAVDSDQSKQTHVHPMDVQMAVFHCSDNFLRQNMINKLSQCQYALPLLVPDPVTKDIECPLWTFRQIRKSWKVTDKSNVLTMKSMPICKAQTPMVSFFRLGSVSSSKSQLMNNLINNRHSTFFHRNCPGSTKSRYLMDGVVEIAWYCPAGRPNDAFSDCVAFCNLHGDALSNEKQRNILTEKASVNVVLLPTLKKGDKCETIMSCLLDYPKPLICLLENDDCVTTEIKQGKYKMGLKDKSQSDVSEQLREIMRKTLSRSCASFKLETVTSVFGIRIDENDTSCQAGKFAASDMLDLLEGVDISQIKGMFLPYQGQLWHEWSRKNKDQYRLQAHIEEEKCKIKQELEEIRQKQCTSSFSELMQLFIKNLQSLPSDEKAYFLKWTQILLDDLFADDFSAVLHKYDEKWSEVLALKKKCDRTDELKIKQTELEEISVKLQAANFGLEHIFREMGQIYEAHASLQLKTRDMKWADYPALAAELMISGHPMELMDGDAGHVPLTWINSLLDEVIKKLGDKRVFVLSVLGIQSSGKSTMLNAMFGLQFAVSAGRCTKGAFMQLVKVSEEIKKDFKFDYILVVDTEGLHALELADNTTLHHDNELATFVIGLGTMTLINIFGENPAEMQDVLQIVVQAFMRMKKVKLSPSCVFVHHDVMDIAAAEKNMDGKRRLQEKLDQMTKLAAIEEECDAECFSDIIAFDVQKDIKYFAQLWEGSPPMAPPNPGYSESIQELKNIILSKASQSNGMVLSQFRSNIGDLWNALLNEHFVFSFKNTLEIAVYRKLEVQYGNWTWTLRSNLLTIENQLYNRIENGKLDKVEPGHIYEEMKKTYEEVRKAMTTHFDEDEDKEMLAQWRGRFENKIKDFHDEQVREVKRKLDGVIQQKKAGKNLDDKKKEFENNLLQKSKELALKSKDKAEDEKELEKQFNHVWSGWVTELTADTQPIKDLNLENEQTAILLDLGFERSLVDERTKCGRFKDIPNSGDYSDYVILTPFQLLPNLLEVFLLRGDVDRIRAVPFEEQQQIRSLIDNVEKQSIAIIKSKPVATQGYRSTYLQEMANYVIEEVKKHELNRTYSLKKKFTVDLLLYVFDIVGQLLLESHKEFKRNNDACTYVESKKKQFYGIFRSFCKGSSSAVVLAELICEKLKVSTVQAVCEKTATDLAREIMCSFSPRSRNRVTLEKHLEEIKGAGFHMSSISESHSMTIKKQIVENYISTEHKDSTLSLLKKNVARTQQGLIRALHRATFRCREESIDMWLKELASWPWFVDKYFVYSQIFSDINKFDFLKEEVEKELGSNIKEVANLVLDDMKKFHVSPDEILVDPLFKCCWVQCPFCEAVCTNIPEDTVSGELTLSRKQTNIWMKCSCCE